MIYFLIGTKAQLIKMFPLMLQLTEGGVQFRYIDTVQHGPLCARLRKTLKLPEPDHLLAPADTQVEGIGHAIRWFLGVLWHGFRQRETLFPEKGIVLVHGDTLSTLLGLILGHLGGNHVCHVEAGERTHKLFFPFPEEIIRRIVDRRSDLLLACGDRQFQNLQLAGIRKKIINLGNNTLFDAVLAVAESGNLPGAMQVNDSNKPPIMVSIHRFETISSRTRMAFLVETLELLCRTDRVILGLHPPTRNKLTSFGFMPRLKQLRNLHLRELFDYPDFIKTMNSSKYILTDGGGPQEESFFLGIPCLLLRSETERTHPNVFMAEWSLEKVEWFNMHCNQFRRLPLSKSASPSARAVAEIMAYAAEN